VKRAAECRCSEHHRQNGLLLPRNGNDDGEKHTVDRDSERIPHRNRKNVSRHRSEQCSQRPTEIRHAHQPEKIFFTDRTFLSARNGKNLIGIAERNPEPICLRNGSIQLLRQGKRHQRVPQIDCQLRQRHFNGRRAGNDQRQPCELPRRGEIRHGNGDGKPHRQSLRNGHHAKGKRNRNISQCDGDSILHAAEKAVVNHLKPFFLPELQPVLRLSAVKLYCITLRGECRV